MTPRHKQQSAKRLNPFPVKGSGLEFGSFILSFWVTQYSVHKGRFVFFGVRVSRNFACSTMLSGGQTARMSNPMLSIAIGPLAQRAHLFNVRVVNPHAGQDVWNFRMSLKAARGLCRRLRR